MSKARKFDAFDSYVGNYRDIHTQNVRAIGADSDYFSQYRAIEVYNREFKRNPQIVFKKEIQLLDVGSGDGNAARFFKQVMPNMHIVGIDISQDVVDSAKQRDVPDAQFLVYDGENFPFADHSFDIVYMVGTLHHVDRAYHSKLCAECYRVLRTGGRYYNFEHNPWNPVTQKIVKDCVFDKDAILLSQPYLKALTLQAGFKSVQSRFTLFFPRFKVFKPLFRLEKYMYWLPLGGQYYIEAEKY